MNKKYLGKRFSILGDSISTLDGFNPSGYNVFYKTEKSEQASVFQPCDTWWGMVIEHLGGVLEVNNSWSGSWVSKLPLGDKLFPSACSEERTGGLHKNSHPDVILVYIGINDWASGAMLKGSDEDSFEGAYDLMLKRIKSNYPNAEIWCCTIAQSFISTNPNVSCRYCCGGWHMEDFNKCIRTAVENNACGLIDFYSYHTPYDTIDLTHPNRSGMKTIFEMVLKAMGVQGNE